jgi:hypothetical protein
MGGHVSTPVGGGLDDRADFLFRELVMRIVLISLATFYVVAAPAVLDRFLFKDGKFR